MELGCAKSGIINNLGVEYLDRNIVQLVLN